MFDDVSESSVALTLQLALTAWNELHPDDSDEDACRKSLMLVETELKALKIPPLHERLRIVMGSDECSIPECISRLRARHESWVPDSKDLKPYISLALSTHVKDLFQRVKRGVYRVRPSADKPPKASNKKAADVPDEVGNVLENPFSPFAA